MAKKDDLKPEKALKPEKVKKDKSKGKDKKGKGAPAAASTPSAPGTPDANNASVPLANMSPEQMTAAQLEQAIKESNDPNTKLKKLRSPLNLRSCLLNIAVLIVFTFGIAILWTYLVVDKFNFGFIMSDMMNKFGITDFFSNIGTTISGWFGG